MLQASSYWREGEPLRIDLAAGRDLAARLAQDKGHVAAPVGQPAGGLSTTAGRVWLQSPGLDAALPMPRNCAGRQLAALAAAIHTWQVVPDGSEGWRKTGSRWAVSTRAN